SSSLVNLVSLCNSLPVLDVSDTQLSLDKLWPALKYGGLQVERLILSGCQVGSKKVPPELSQTVKEFFALAVGLRVVERGAAPVLEAGLPGVSARVLSLRDNNFEAEMLGVVSALAGMPELKRLDVGGSNLTSLRRSGKPLNTFIRSTKSCSNWSNWSEMTGIWKNAYSQQALQLNASLRTILIDGNHITWPMDSRINYTLVTLPYPVLDACEAIVRSDKAKTLNALSQIETVLERNNAHSAPASANFKRALFTLNQQSDGMSWDSVCAAEGVLRAVADQPLPLKLRADTITFVEQLRTQMRAHLKETFSHGDEEPNSRAITNLENLACDRLKELLVRDIGSVYAEWKWRSACSTAERSTSIRLGCTSSGSGSMTSSSSHGSSSPSSAMASSRTFPRQDGHRPRSIVGDLSSHSGEAGLTLEAPPKPSALVHPLTKGRPKPQRQAQLGRGAVYVVIPHFLTYAIVSGVSSLTSAPGRSVCEVVCETDEPLSDRPMFRVAMLPKAAAMARTTQIRRRSNIGSQGIGDKFRMSHHHLRRHAYHQSHPVVGLCLQTGNIAPLRTSVAQLPHVPPPVPVETEDDENANIEGSPTNRRSVARPDPAF
ncbi:unnamed protein product, partial [Mesorhabditis spiculigera]